MNGCHILQGYISHQSNVYENNHSSQWAKIVHANSRISIHPLEVLEFTIQAKEKGNERKAS
jgi:hypothetical protein